MRSQRLTVLFVACLLPVLGAADVATDEAITGVVLDYAEGWFAGDAGRMERALHPDFLRRRLVTDSTTGEQAVQQLDAQAMILATARGVGRSAWSGPLEFRVTILDRYGDLADVRVVSPLYVDYLHLVKWQGRWVILSALWGPYSG